MLHTSFATKSSEFFKSAISGTWTESSSKRITLAEVQPKTFERYLNWLYTSTIPLEVEDSLDPKNDVQRGTIANSKYRQLLHAYVLRYFLLDRPFRNAIIDAMRKVQSELYYVPSTPAVCYFYDKMPPNCQTIRLITSSWAYMLTPEDMSEEDEGLPAAFLVGLVTKILAVRASGPQNSGLISEYPCEFHEHEEGDPPCS